LRIQGPQRVLADDLIGEGTGDPFVHLPDQPLDPLPRHNECRGDDQDDRRPEQQLALGRQRDVQPTDPLEHRVRTQS
jgi:hypothetical protein